MKNEEKPTPESKVEGVLRWFGVIFFIIPFLLFVLFIVYRNIFGR